MNKNHLAFIKEFFSEFESTGSCCSTSRWAADALTEPLKNAHGAKRILEVGPGTGSVTKRILKRMSENDTLAICEINPRFLKELKKRLSANPNYIKHRKRITFFEGAIQDFPEKQSFDLIISALPLLNFEVETVKDIFRKFSKLSAENALLTYYEYIAIRPLSCRVSPPQRRQRLKKLDSYLKEIVHVNELPKRRVWRNLLPISVYTMRLSSHPELLRQDDFRKTGTYS